MKINITKNGQTISLESDSAGVPDVTNGAGPDLLELQDDAKKNPSDPNAEFNADDPSTQSQTEHDDTPEQAQKANEAFRLVAGMVKKDPTLVKKLFAGQESDEPDNDGAPAEPPAAEPAATEPAAEPATEPEADNNAEVTQTSDATVVEVDGVKIEITNDDAPAATEPAAEPAAEPATEPETSTEGDDTAANPDQSLESLFANLDLQKL